MIMKSLDVTWAAGLFEGEGYVGLQSCVTNGRRYGPYPRLAVKMSDLDVIRRLGEVFPQGIVGSDGHRPGRKPMWAWSVYKPEHVIGIAFTLYPLLGERRQARIREVVAAWKHGTRQVDESPDETAARVNRGRAGSRSSHRGVYLDARDGKWYVQVKHEGQRHNGGRFDTEEEAATVAEALRAQVLPKGTKSYFR
jgi:hypothetical protein